MAKPLIKPLYQAALRMTRQREWAEDLVQDTLIRAYERIELFKAGTNFRAWLFTILTNTYLNDCERGRRRPLTTSFDVMGVNGSIWEFPATEENDPVFVLMAHVLEDQLQSALDALSDEFRLAVLLVDIEEMSYQEAADALSVPIGTIRSRVSRGRFQIRQYLGKQSEIEMH